MNKLPSNKNFGIVFFIVDKKNQNNDLKIDYKGKFELD